MKRLVVVLAITFAVNMLGSLPREAHADFDFPSLISISVLNLVGSAAPHGSVLRLTSAMVNQAGARWSGKSGDRPSKLKILETLNRYLRSLSTDPKTTLDEHQTPYGHQPWENGSLSAQNFAATFELTTHAPVAQLD